MPCFSPLKGFRSASGGWTSNVRQSPTKTPMVVPCGQCIGCRISRREQWVTRMMHEASLHEANCFFTLTYEDDKLPPWGSLRMRHVSEMFKRLRTRISPVKIRFQSMGEYGPRTQRPHYHGLMFGYDFPDREMFGRSAAGELRFVSPLLSDVWGHGFAECSDLTVRSVRYCAKHNVDKLNGPLVDDAFYSPVDPVTGEVGSRERERSIYSNRPGIGSGWLDKFESDCFPSGFIVEDGRKVTVPRYYKKRLKDRFELSGSSNDPKRLVPVDDYSVMARKSKERLKSSQVIENSTPERLAVREEVKLLSLNRLKRDAI